MAVQFQHGLCGCFDNCCICIVTYYCPCYTAGKIAEKLGESCILHGILLFVPIANIICRCIIRGKVREQNGISGSGCNDLCSVWFCGACTLCQEVQEVNAFGDKSMAVVYDTIERA